MTFVAPRLKPAQAGVTGTIRLSYPREIIWRPTELTMSALIGEGLVELWQTVLKHRQVAGRRRRDDVRNAVLDRVRTHPEVRRIRANVARRVREGG